MALYCSCLLLTFLNQVNNTLSNASITGADQQNNLVTSNPGFGNPDGNDFHLRADSPAIDASCIIAGITDGYAGSALDIGAYTYCMPL